MKWFGLPLLLMFSLLAFGQEKGIPTKYMNDPAVDLTRNGKLLFPDEVHDLVQNSRGKFDISQLNPSETSDLWKNVFLKQLPEERTPISEMDELNYHSPVLSPSGIFRFNITTTNGDKKLYTMMLSKTVHSILLAKSLLRKLGYQIPDIKYLPKIVVKFKDEAQKKEFVSYLENIAFAGSAKNWILEDLGDRLVLQDLVVTSSSNIIYNLAVGVTSDMIQGRRLLSSLAVPLSIINLTESVNMLRWNAGVENNKRIILYHDNLEDFQCTWDDARWITRRIEKLTRDDWREIVSSTFMPKAVQQILLEKLVSRRNSVMKLFKIDAEEFSVDGHLNNGIELVDGKLTQQVWPGYGSRFSHGDPESPLSDSDMKSWIKSRVISTAMELAIGQINQLPYLGTDIAAINSEKYKTFFTSALNESVANNTAFQLPVKSWAFPTFRGNLIMSRNLVTGTYLGTDNLVQLVDSVGVSLSAGIHVGTMGIEMNNALTGSLMPINVSGGAKGSYVRTYSHLRPVIDIKRSLKYPFKNILVPLVKVDFGRKLHEAILTSIDPNSSENDRFNSIESALRPFKDAINVGESLIVTDSVTTGAGAEAGANIYGKILSTSIGLNAGHIVISRFHVHRKTEDDFHIYKDLGHKGSAGLSFNLNSFIPVLSLNLKKSAGHAKIKFFSLNLNKKNPEVFKNASALRKAIIHSSIGEVEENNVKPYVLKHTFKESAPSMSFLFWQLIKQSSSTNFSVTNQLGEERFFRRYYYGKTQGRNYQAYVNAVINHWVGLLFNKDANLSDATGVNPGYSFKGQAKTNYLTLDEELDSQGNVVEPFINLNRVWNGWSINRKDAEKLLEEIRQEYRFPFFNAPVLNDTSKIYLYNVGVNMFFYKAGIEHLLSLDENRIKRIFLENKKQESLVITPNIPEEEVNEDFEAEIYSESGAAKFIRLLKRYRKYLGKQKDDRANKYLLRALSYMDKTLYLSGITALMGGDENLYVISKITGFREGDEDGDRSLISSSLGQFGSQQILGPVVQVQKNTQMLEGEFFINWLMQRLI
jgi:hypothetical protein